MHQYIREQADALAQRRMGEYQQPREWEVYETQRQVPSYQGPYFRGGPPDDRRDDEPDKEEDEEEDTDEETESVTSSSQVSAHRA